jgi:hypothetical protein
MYDDYNGLRIVVFVSLLLFTSNRYPALFAFYPIYLFLLIPLFEGE